MPPISLRIGIGVACIRGSGSSSGGSAIPALISATIAANGTTLTLVFSESMQIGGGGLVGLSVIGSGSGSVLSSIGTPSGSTIVCTLASAIEAGETFTVSYDQPAGGIQDLDGNDLASLVAWSTACTNNSTQVAFSPADIANLAFALDADDLAGLSDGANITAWTGLASSAVTVPATNPKKQTANGFPVCRFAGSDRLTSNAFLDSGFNTAFTLVFVAAVTDGDLRVIASQNGVNFYAAQDDVLIQFYGAALSAGSTTKNQSRREPQIVSMRYDGATKTIKLNSLAATTAASTGNLGMTGSMSIGALSDGSYPWNGDLRCLYVYKRAITDLELASLTAHIVEHNIGFAGWGSVIFEGDSLTAGTGSTAGNDYPSLVIAAMTSAGLNTNYTANKATGGHTILDMQSDLASFILPEIDPGGLRIRDVVFVWGGTNDISLGASASTVQSRLQTYCGDIKAAGGKVVVLTCIARGDFDATEESHRIAYNTWIRANYTSFADKLIDVASEPEFDTTADTANTTYYTDGTHLTDAGYAIVADLVFAEINPW